MTPLISQSGARSLTLNIVANRGELIQVGTNEKEAMYQIALFPQHCFPSKIPRAVEWNDLTAWRETCVIKFIELHRMFSLHA